MAELATDPVDALIQTMLWAENGDDRYGPAGDEDADAS